MEESIEQVEILIAEDNPNDYELMARALKKINLANSIHWVKDGAEALDFLFCSGAYSGRSPDDRPRLVILDLKMPKVSGIDVLRKVKADERTRSLPVVMLTSSQEESDLVESYKLGANSYIVKPVEFEKFVETVSQAGLYWMVINKTAPR